MEDNAEKRIKAIYISFNITPIINEVSEIRK